MSSKLVQKTAGFVIGAVLIGIGIATGNVALIVQGGAMIVTQAIVDLTMPHAPARSASEMTIALGEQPRVMMVGEAFTPGSLVDGFNWGGKYDTDWECLIIRLADHKCHSLTGFYVNDEYNAYTGDGEVGRYDDKLKIFFRSDTTTQPLPDDVLDNGPGWTSDDIGESGCDVIVCYKADKPDAKHPVWPGGRPRFGFVLKGKLCYDPRLDSTVTGGSGSHRWDDPDTWEWSENAVICWYQFQRGVYANDDSTDQSKLLVGRGLSAEESPPEYIFAAANLCDEIQANIYPWRQAANAGSINNLAFSPDGSRIYAIGATGFYIYDVWTQSQLLYTDAGGLSFGGPIGVDSSGLYLLHDHSDLYFCELDGSGLGKLGNTGVIAGYTGVRVLDGVPYLTTVAGGQCCYWDGATFQFVGVAQGGLDYFRDLAGNHWSSGTHASDSYFYCLSGPRLGESYILPSIGFDLVIANPNGDFFALSGGDTYLLANADFSILATGSSPGAAANGAQQTPPGSATIWVGNQEVSTTTLAIVRNVATGSFLPTATLEIAKAYDRINNALIVHPTAGAEAGWYWLFLDRHGGYRVSGPIYANQEFLEVEEMFALATAGNTVTREGSVELEPGQAKSVVASFTDDDLLVGSEVTWNQGFLSQANSEWVNTVVARYVEPNQKWSDHAAPVLRDTDDIIADGKPREASITLRLVRYQAQALRIAEIARRKGRLWGRANVKLGPRFCELEEGDWIQWQSDRYFGGGTKTFVIMSYAIDEKWQVALTLSEISGSVFADDASSSWPSDQSTTSMSPITPPIGAPDAGDWTLTATTLDSAGASVPVLEVTGAVPTDDPAEAVIVEYWQDDGVIDPVANPDAPAWLMHARYSPLVTKSDISGLAGGAAYYVAISYVVSGITSDRLVLGPESIADLDVTGQIEPARRLTIVTVSGTTYALTAADDWRHLRFTNAAGCTVTIPKNATAAYPIGGRTRMTVAPGNAVGVVLVPEDGTVTLNSRDNALTSAGEKAVLEVEKVATNEWDILGDVTT